MARRRLLGGMALLLLQALPGPLSVRAEPPQVRGRVVLRPEGPGWGPRGRRGVAGEGLKEHCHQELQAPESVTNA